MGAEIKKKESSARHLATDPTSPSGVIVGESSRPRLTIKQGDAGEVEKKKERTKTKFFYKVKNHQELFKLGTSFYKDFRNGIRSFAIGSTGYQSSQQRSILGLASFFDHKYDVDIAIISDNLYDGVFKEIVESSEEHKVPLDYSGQTCSVHTFHNHFEFVDLESLLEQSNQSQGVDYESRIRNFCRNYDIIFWDVPELHKIKNDPEIYYPMIMMFDSLSIVVARTLTSTEEIKDVTSFFMAYGINLKGLVFDQNLKGGSTSSQPKSKKPWWRRFFS